jgi:hypothetical protein
VTSTVGCGRRGVRGRRFLSQMIVLLAQRMLGERGSMADSVKKVKNVGEKQHRS